MSFSVGFLQAWIFKDQVKSKLIFFVLLIISGGVIGGISAGVLSALLEFVHEYLVKMVPYLELGLTSILLNFFEGLLVGTLAGSIIGVASGYAYIWLVHNSRYSRRYFVYTFFSWAVFCSVGWSFGYVVNDFLKSTFIGYAFGIFLILIAYGISFITFLHFTPQIEFS